MYTITDLYHNLKLTLTTNTTNTSGLRLKTYVNDTLSKTYEGTVSNDTVTFTIPHSDYDINDVITKFELVQTGSTDLYKTNEGVIVLLDGEIIDVGKVTTSGGTDTLVKDSDGLIVTEEKLSNNKFYLNFNNSGEHDIQAVYLGNNSTKFAKTDKVHFKVSQPPLDESGSTSNDGKYVLEFVEATTPKLKYKDNTKIYFRLTKGGVPVAERTIQRQYPNGGVGSSSTTDKGLVYMQNTNWNAGKYKIGAFYFDETSQKVITSTYRDIEISKATPTLTDNFEDAGTFVKGSNYKAQLMWNKTPLKNVKVSIYVNTKQLVLKTNNQGEIFYSFKAKGTFNLKVVYTGDKNFEKAELTRTITISE